MTLQEVGHIDELIAWLDNEQDGAEDAGFVAQSATNWHPALVALRARLWDLAAALVTTEKARDRWHQKYTVEAQARKDETQVLGDALTALRERHAEAVEAAFKEGRSSDQRAQDDAAWLASEAKARLT